LKNHSASCKFRFESCSEREVKSASYSFEDWKAAANAAANAAVSLAGLCLECMALTEA